MWPLHATFRNKMNAPALASKVGDKRKGGTEVKKHGSFPWILWHFAKGEACCACEKARKMQIETATGEMDGNKY